MKKYFIQYKLFLIFLGKFLVTYLLLTFLYQTYLNQFIIEKAEVDSFTKIVANQTVSILKLTDSDTYTLPHLKEPSMKLIYKGKYISRIIEGCNALSVIILFAAFVIAFSGKIKNTFFFILFGAIIIHVLNISRIALLSIAMFYYPQYQDFLHGVVFPLFIYGVVFILWIVWVNKFSFYAKAT